MAKKVKKDVYYFPHDYNPTSDPKMLAFIGEFGAIGYGVYWRIVEMLHESKEHVLPLKKYIYSAIAKQMLIDVEQVLNIVEGCINDYELFETDDEYFWCNRVLRNVEKRIELIAKKVKAGEASARKRQEKKEAEEKATRVEQTSTGVQHNLTEGNKLNKIKLNEIIEYKNKINNPSNQNIKIDTDSDLQKRIETFEKICQKFLEEDIQNFVDYFKTLDIREENIKEALKDYKDDKLIGEVKSIPFKYSYFKEWFKKYITDNRAKYVHVPKFRVTHIDEKAERRDLHAAFDFYWNPDYTIEFIREKIYSGEFKPKNDLNFKKLIDDKIITTEND